MNGGPFRGSQADDRRAVPSRPEPARRVEEPQPVQQHYEEPKTTHRSSSSHHAPKQEKKSLKGLIWTLVIVAVVVILGVVGWLVFANSQKENLGVDTSKYQAVFLVNGQIYFGKLEAYNDNSYRLTKIYYPQSSATTTEDGTTTADTSKGIQLIRLGDEVHGPESEMFVSKDQVLYYENLKSDSKVTQLIDQNEK